MISENINAIGKSYNHKVILHNLMIIPCMLFLVVSNFVFSLMLQLGIDAASGNDLMLFTKAAVGFFVASLLYGWCFYVVSQRKQVIQLEVSKEVKSKLLTKYMRLDQRCVNDLTEGDLLTIVNVDAQQVSSELTTVVLPFIQMCLTLLIGGWYVAYYSKEMLVLVLCCSGIFYVVNSLLLKKIQQSFLQLQNESACQKEYYTDFWKNGAVIRIFQLRDVCDKIYGTIFAKKKDASVSHVKNKAYSKSFSEGTILFVEFFVLVIGIYYTKLGYLSLGALVGVWNASIGAFIYPMMDLPDILARRAEIRASKQRIVEFMDQNEENVVIENHELKNPMLVLNEVSFGFDADSLLFQGVSFRVEIGDIVVIKGESGVGKSSLIRLLLGMYSPKSGSIYIEDDGVRYTNLRNSISYVPQDSGLLFGGIRDNLMIEDNEDEALRYLEALKLTEIVERIGGIHGEHFCDKDDFSVGELRRLSIIRAALRESSFILLDEPYASLDVDHIEMVTTILNELRQTHGIILVTHIDVNGLLANKKYLLEGGMIHETSL